jgi:hypothetical protein
MSTLSIPEFPLYDLHPTIYHPQELELSLMALDDDHLSALLYSFASPWCQTLRKHPTTTTTGIPSGGKI